MRSKPKPPSPPAHKWCRGVAHSTPSLKAYLEALLARTIFNPPRADARKACAFRTLAVLLALMPEEVHEKIFGSFGARVQRFFLALRAKLCSLIQHDAEHDHELLACAEMDELAEELRAFAKTQLDSESAAAKEVASGAKVGIEVLDATLDGLGLRALALVHDPALDRVESKVIGKADPTKPVIGAILLSAGERGQVPCHFHAVLADSKRAAAAAAAAAPFIAPSMKAPRHDRHKCMADRERQLCSDVARWNDNKRALAVETLRAITRFDLTEGMFWLRGGGDQPSEPGETGGLVQSTGRWR